ncbi:hypothetical protein [Amycolatopsis keratiniphila]|uniref:Thiocillin family RiPP n=1 Tax=Amycolatopsis keratiniphila subsp. keratiniphila TaxID=227715 RepID=A0A1W2LWT1_9PSEU|nr:hypothetical protein [Amycolatopsis keratiniphila]OLZ47264.1 hypothetical protein BS330_34940 [Amycolatopsis keratiniphila subsp. nogabecina]ONF71371.1 hypothetical protein AVR91_0211835 [Amycolatopsis keratiniphila subsp. keratiniphila]SDU38603.1 hypothetical protein SAMN04489733_3633 [Amycolatopsis keratiniphila]
METNLNLDATLDLWVEENVATVAADCCAGSASTGGSFGSAGTVGSTVSTGGSMASAGSASSRC